LQEEDSKCAQEIVKNLSRVNYINNRAGALQESPELKEFLSPTSKESGVFFIAENRPSASYPALSVMIAQILKERRKSSENMLYLSIFINERRTEVR